MPRSGRDRRSFLRRCRWRPRCSCWGRKRVERLLAGGANWNRRLSIMQKTRIIAGLGVVLIAMLFVVVQHSLSTGIRVVVLILGLAV